MSDDGCSGLHLARKGEPVYFSIQRERSGIGAGNLDFSVPHERIRELCEADYQELLRLIVAGTDAIGNARRSPPTVRPVAMSSEQIFAEIEARFRAAYDGRWSEDAAARAAAYAFRENLVNDYEWLLGEVKRLQAEPLTAERDRLRRLVEEQLTIHNGYPIGNNCSCGWCSRARAEVEKKS